MLEEWLGFELASFWLRVFSSFFENDFSYCCWYDESMICCLLRPLLLLNVIGFIYLMKSYLPADATDVLPPQLSIVLLFESPITLE